MPRGPEHPGIPEDPSARVIPVGACGPCAPASERGEADRLHQRLLRSPARRARAISSARAAALGDVLLVGLNSDASVRRLKGRGDRCRGPRTGRIFSPRFPAFPT